MEEAPSKYCYTGVRKFPTLDAYYAPAIDSIFFHEFQDEIVLKKIFGAERAHRFMNFHSNIGNLVFRLEVEGNVSFLNASLTTYRSESEIGQLKAAKRVFDNVFESYELLDETFSALVTSSALTDMGLPEEANNFENIFYQYYPFCKETFETAKFLMTKFGDDVYKIFFVACQVPITGANLINYFRIPFGINFSSDERLMAFLNLCKKKMLERSAITFAELWEEILLFAERQNITTQTELYLPDASRLVSEKFSKNIEVVLATRSKETEQLLHLNDLQLNHYESILNFKLLSNGRLQLIVNKEKDLKSEEITAWMFHYWVTELKNSIFHGKAECPFLERRIINAQFDCDIPRQCERCIFLSEAGKISKLF